MISFPPCKINLGLFVLRKRVDGYHDLSTCFYPIGWTDILEIIPSSELSFASTGLSIPGKEEDNLCLRAYKLLQTDFALPPVKIHLHKIVPMGAGLGGGSADAAHTLRLLNKVFELQLGEDKLIRYASQLGSDCAFFCQDNARMGSGRGDVLTSVQVKLKGMFLVLVVPPVHASTAEAYAQMVPRGASEELQNVIETMPLPQWKDVVKNDFEKSVIKKYPLIGEIKDKLYASGALYASMSGSGSSVYGIFEKALNLRAEFQGYLYWGETLRI